MHKMMVPLKRYAQFSGRASRSEFWWFQLFIVIVSITPGDNRFGAPVPHV